MGKKKKSSKKERKTDIIVVLLFVLLGVIISFVSSKYGSGNSGFSFIYDFIILIIILYIQIIIHEFGHLLFGLLSGYGFSSFRIGSLMLIRENNKMKVKKYSLAGTGGQCLMSPPKMENMPYVLYFLGGAILNLLTAIISCIILFLTDFQFIPVVLVTFSLIGILYAITNGLPIKTSLVATDGYYAFSIKNNSEKLKALWIQLEVANQTAKGIRIKDMPEEWFYISSKEELKDSLIATVAVYYCNRLMDLHEFSKAKKEMKKLLAMDTAMIGIHSQLLINDIVYCNLILNEETEKIESLLNKNQRKFMKAMKNFPSIIRTEYTYNLFQNKEREMEKQKLLFQKVSKSYPYACEIQCEKELMEIGKDKIKNT